MLGVGVVVGVVAVVVVVGLSAVLELRPVFAPALGVVEEGELVVVLEGLVVVPELVEPELVEPEPLEPEPVEPDEPDVSLGVEELDPEGEVEVEFDVDPEPDCPEPEPLESEPLELDVDEPELGPAGLVPVPLP